jgi:hypothetical protein
MAALDCVINHTKLTYDENYYDISRNSVRLTFSLPQPHTWDFFENGNWFQKGDVSAQGRWVCDGEEDYKITNTLGEVFISKIAVWLSSPKSDPKFYCVANALYHAQRFKRHKKLRGKNSISIIMNKSTWIFNEDKTFIGSQNDGTDNAYNYVGTWKCLGNNTFEITDNTYGEKWTDGPGNGWVGLDDVFSCVANYFNDNKKTFTFSSDKLIRKTSWGTRYFYKSKQFVDIKTVDGKPVADDSGTWECDGERDWKLNSKKSGIYSSKTQEWIDAPITPEQTEEPTYDKSKFPLRLGSQGTEVVQLQNYLNKQIPMDPLVVNGIFDKKTQDKLIQLQKSTNQLK